METTVSRRSLVKGAAVAGAVLAGGGCVLAASQGSALATDGTDGAGAAATTATEPRQYGFWINTANCVGCFNCIDACIKANKTKRGKDRMTYHVIENTAGERRRFLTPCQHCTNPACLNVCPAGAITKEAGGIVRVNKDRCIGCKYCYQACPFGVPKYTSKGMDKCDCCTEAGVVLGEQTNCAKACKYDALHYGRIDDLKTLSEKAGKVGVPIDNPTGPNILFS